MNIAAAEHVVDNYDRNYFVGEVMETKPFTFVMHKFKESRKYLINTNAIYCKTDEVLCIVQSSKQINRIFSTR